MLLAVLFHGLRGDFTCVACPSLSIDFAQFALLLSVCTTLTAFGVNLRFFLRSMQCKVYCDSKCDNARCSLGADLDVLLWSLKRVEA